MMCRIWSQWRDEYNKLKLNNASFEEYEQCLQKAQQLAVQYGNSNCRSVKQLKMKMNVVNQWRGKVHHLLKQPRWIPNEELQKVLNEYPVLAVDCKEKDMLKQIIQRKEELESEVDNA